MKVRLKNGNELPTGWSPGQPLSGKSVELHDTQQCPFGADCHSCRDGLQWYPAFETHLKPPLAER
jgi:hypothetical protein